MHRQIAAVTEHDGIRVLSLSVIANRAFGIFDRQSCGSGDLLDLYTR